MATLRVHITISLDGYATGTDQRLDAPFGDGFDGMHEWAFTALRDRAAGRTGTDVEFLDRSERNVGATIMGRNMFGPFRGPWQDESWTGWWGDNPPYHHDVFVHTHHPRPTLPMEGGTTFHFTDEPVEVVARRALDAAGGRDVRVGGGPTVIQEYVRAGLVDELDLTVVPVLVGGGIRLLDGLGDATGRFRVAEQISSDTVTHVRMIRH